MSGAPAGPAAVGANRLDTALARTPALICYLPLGDPAIALAPPELAEVYVGAGVDVLEVGLPVPEPYADGSTIRGTMARARDAGLDPASAARLTGELRGHLPGQAIAWMTYADVLPADALADLAVGAGVDGLLLVEPAHRFGALRRRLEAAGVHLLQFLPRDAGPADVAAARAARGYVMVQAVAGATGARPDVLPDSTALLARLRADGVTAPLVLGIGVARPDHVRAALAMGADGVVVGSATVEAALEGPAALGRLLAGLREACRA
jgi:tryptophan synthase alpha chain